MTSIISFFVLLLITYSYSIPVEKVHDGSIVHYEFTTDKTMVDHENISHMPSMHNEELTGTPNMHKKRFNPVDIPPKQTTTEESVHVQDIDRRRESPVQGLRSTDDEESLRTEDIDRRSSSDKEERSIDGDDNDEVTTTDVYRPSRTFEETSYPSTTIKSTSDYSSPNEEHDKRSFIDEFSTTTIETSIEFNRRAIGPMIKETSNVNNIETSTNVKPSSVDSLDKMTRLLHDPSSEESTTTQSSFKPVSISPGRMTVTKIYSAQPSKTSIVTEQVQQLSQGQKQPVIETKKSN